MDISEDAGRRDERDPLWAAFVDPPDAARPRAWWHWMDGNIDPAGILRDLDWLHSAGVRGVQLFDGGMGVPLVVPEAVRPGSAAWTEAIDTAVRTCDERGLELAVATSSGWSAAGGPWVRPEDAMKKVVWSEVVVDGGAPLELTLPPLPSVAGLYQDAPRWGGSDAAAFATDWVVLGVPHDASQEQLTPATFTASAPLGDWSCLTDAAFGTTVSLPRDPERWSRAWIEQTFNEPVTVRSVVVGLPGPRGFGAAPPASTLLQASDDGITYRDVIDLEPTSVPARTATFAPVTARRFRLVLSGASAAEALPHLADGVRMPPVLRSADAFLVSEFALRTAARVHHAEAKAGFGVVEDYFAVDTDPRAEHGSIDPAAVIDLTPLTEDDVLRWMPPPGRWRILRLGASLTGQTNGPAPADSTGLEVDKLDGERVSAYLDAHLSRFGDRADAFSEGSRFSALLSDSIEAGPQNWTDRIRDVFWERREYDPLPYLPALAGYVVGDVARTDRFLFDYRRTLAEQFAHAYYGSLATAAHRRGMTYYAEALEDGRPQLGDDLLMRSHADVPMGAMWTFESDGAPRPTYLADLKGASSVAHVYGKEWTGSEAFTSFGAPWSSSPQSLKHIADLQLSLGVTRFCIHTSPHQPLSTPPPGIALAPFLGQVFTVTETWSGMARPWIDYLARCSAMLSAGAPAVEIAVFIGEEAPVTALFEAAPDMTVPEGFDFDYVGPDSLAHVLRVQDGDLVAEGARYRLLYLGGSSRRLSVDCLRHIERLLDAGATVVGRRPACSPSLGDDPATFRLLCDRIWAPGRVIAGDLDAGLTALGLRPALRIEGAPVRRIARVIDDRRVTFLSNPSGDEIVLRVFAAHDLVGWDPVEVRRAALEPITDDDGPDGVGRIVSLAPFGSLFVLEDIGPVSARDHVRVPLDGEWRTDLPGIAPILTSPDPEPWTESSPAARTFSGTGVYRHVFSLTPAQTETTELLLTFDSVRDIARVVLNGQDCGVVWTPPFRVDVSHAARVGRNELEVHVATPWRNRLIAEATTPTGEIFEPMTGVFEPSASLGSAGLSGAVALLIDP